MAFQGVAFACEPSLFQNQHSRWTGSSCKLKRANAWRWETVLKVRSRHSEFFRDYYVFEEKKLYPSNLFSKNLINDLSEGSFQTGAGSKDLKKRSFWILDPYFYGTGGKEF